MQIKKIGTDKRLDVCERLLSSELAERAGELILLPIPTTKDKIHINGTDTTLAEVIDMADDSTTVVGYSMPCDFKQSLLERGVRVLDISMSEGFLFSNAKVTAEGTLGYILTSFESVPSDMKIGIIGYGRIGRCLTNMLLFLGARLTVYTTRESLRRELGELGVNCEKTGEGCDFSDLDLLINTAPAPFAGIFSEGKPKIFELASGENFPPELEVKRLPSLPALMYPSSAGRLYAKYILKGLD